MKKQELFQKIDTLYKNDRVYASPLLTEQALQTLHRLCCQDNTAGQYRNVELSSAGKGHKPPHPDEIPHFMGHFMNQLETSHIMFHPIEFAAIAYKRLLDLSPFREKNEETAALFLNVLLASEGYPLIQNPVCLDGYEAAMEKARIMPFPDTDDLTALIGQEILRQI